ncbi:MAG: hypothetical protein K2Y14_11815 [Burkholderiales bacterium]|nr:hypothetical protein [Burkholderiales bacterium]
MKNKLLLVIAAVLVAGCADRVEYDTALKDPVTLNLVKQSIVDYKTIQQNQWVHSYDNGCYFTLVGFLPDKPIACDALDLRLNNKGIAVSASSLVAYYMNEQAEAQEKAKNQRIKDEAAAKQTQIESMANGK